LAPSALFSAALISLASVTPAARAAPPISAATTLVLLRPMTPIRAALEAIARAVAATRAGSVVRDPNGDIFYLHPGSVPARFMLAVRPAAGHRKNCHFDQRVAGWSRHCGPNRGPGTRPGAQ